MRLRLKSGLLDLSTPKLMGILNLTPDSFSDGGRHNTPDAALARAREMIGQGAELLDVGGESTRPGAAPVAEQEELDRVIPLIERLRAESGVVISIDTTKPAVMRAACAAGADLINDVMALRAEGALEAAREAGAAVCLMHMQGVPRTMQQAPHYEDVVGEVEDFLRQRVAACIGAGIPAQSLMLDPGFGFGKRLDHNLRLLDGLGRLAALGYPLLVGLSRKAMFGQILGAPLERRLSAGLAAATAAVLKGAAIIRTHDVAETLDAVRVAAAIRDAGQETRT